MPHRLRYFKPRVLSLLWFLLAHVIHRDRSLRRVPGQPPLALAPFVKTRIDHQAVQPRRKLRVSTKLANGCEQLQKDLLGDVFRERSIATGRIDGNGEDLVFVSFKQTLKGVAVALLAGFNNLSVYKLLSHGRAP